MLINIAMQKGKKIFLMVIVINYQEKHSPLVVRLFQIWPKMSKDVVEVIML